MVHRPIDSRLLSNLLSQEKEYHKQLTSLLDTSHTSISSFSAYASASSPPTSGVILSVAGCLSAADEGLKRYALAVEECSQRMRELKELEDEVGNVLRDREILVTRLIKASKSTKPSNSNRLSFTLHPQSSLSSLQSSGSSPLPLPGSFPSSTSSTSSFTSPYHPSSSSPFNPTSLSPAPSPFNPAPPTASHKLTLAQSELQACEAHLALKERELAQRRAGAVREGMSGRCRALVECGWVWGEVGREGLRVLEELGGSGSEATKAATNSNPSGPSKSKPLPDPHPSRPSSDLSSLAPSQSASQVEPNHNAPSSSSSHYAHDASHYAHDASHYAHDEHHLGMVGTGMAGMGMAGTGIGGTGAGGGAIHVPPAHAITDSSGNFYPYAPSSSGPSAPGVTTSHPPSTSHLGPPVEAVGNASATSTRHVLERRITEEELSASHERPHREGEEGEGSVTPQQHLPPPPIPEKEPQPPASHPPHPPHPYPNQENEGEEAPIIDNDDSSSINEPTPPLSSLQIVENPRFATPQNSSRISLGLNRPQKPGAISTLPSVQLPPSTQPTIAQTGTLKAGTYPPLGSGNPPPSPSKHRRFVFSQNRRESYDSRNSDTGKEKSGFFGSLGRSLFGAKKEKKDGSDVSTSNSPRKGVIDLNASPGPVRVRPQGRGGVGVYAAAVEESDTDSSDDGEGPHRGRRGLRGLFSHHPTSHNATHSATAGMTKTTVHEGGGANWSTRTDRNLSALQNPQRGGGKGRRGHGHGRAGSVDQVNILSSSGTGVMKGGGAERGRKLDEIVANAGVSGRERKRVASDVGYSTPPRLQTTLPGALSSSGNSPSSTTRPGLPRSPSDVGVARGGTGTSPGGGGGTGAGAGGAGGRKLKKRITSGKVGQGGQGTGMGQGGQGLERIEGGRSDDDHDGLLPHTTTAEKGKAREVGGGGGGGGGGDASPNVVRRKKSTKRSSSVPPVMSGSASTATITPQHPHPSHGQNHGTIQGGGTVPTTVTTHHAGGAVLVTGGREGVTGSHPYPNQVGSSSAAANAGVGGASLSRNGSLMSAMSGPPLLLVQAPSSGHPGAHTGVHQPTPHHSTPQKKGKGREGGGGSALGVAGERSIPLSGSGGGGKAGGGVKRSSSLNAGSSGSHPTTTVGKGTGIGTGKEKETGKQPFVIRSAPPPASSSLASSLAIGGVSKPAAGGVGGGGMGMEVKAPRRVDREELEREVQVASGSRPHQQHSQPQQQHSHQQQSRNQATKTGQAVQRQQQPATPTPTQRKSIKMEVPSAPRSVLEQQPQQHPVLSGSATPTPVVAPQPRQATSSSLTPVPSTSTPPHGHAHQQLANATLSPSPSLHRQHDKSPLRSALKNSTTSNASVNGSAGGSVGGSGGGGSGGGQSRSPSPEKPQTPSHRSASPLKSALKNSTANAASASGTLNATPMSMPNGAGRLGVGQGMGVSRTPSPLAMRPVAVTGSPASSPAPAPAAGPSSTPILAPAPVPVAVVEATPAPPPAPIPRPAAVTSPDLDRRLSVATIASMATDDDEYETADEDDSSEDEDDGEYHEHENQLPRPVEEEEVGETEEAGEEQGRHEESTPTHTAIPLPTIIAPTPVLAPSPSTQSLGMTSTSVPIGNGHVIQPLLSPSPTLVPPAVALSAQTSEEGSAIGSAVGSVVVGEGTGQVKRRKSVRVSLQPTFTPTPPAIEYSDEEEEAGAMAPWGGRNSKSDEEERHEGGQPAGVGKGKDGKQGKETKEVKGKKGGKKDGKVVVIPDVWEDSSEEDVEYSRARRLLNKLGRKKDHHR